MWSGVFACREFVAQGIETRARVVERGTRTRLRRGRRRRTRTVAYSYSTLRFDGYVSDVEFEVEEDEVSVIYVGTLNGRTKRDKKTLSFDRVASGDKRVLVGSKSDGFFKIYATNRHPVRLVISTLAFITVWAWGIGYIIILIMPAKNKRRKAATS